MTSLDARPLPVSTTRSPDRTLRLALAVTAPLALVAIGVGKLVTPYDIGADGAGVLAAASSDPGAMDTLGWLRLAITLFLLPGVVVTGLAALRGAPRLATAGLLVAVPSWAAAFAFPDTDGLATALVATGVPADDAARLFDEVAGFGTPATGVAVLLFVVGHIVGTVLLGLALWRSRAVPAPVAWALTISQPLHFVAFVILLNAPLDAIAAFLTALGFGAAGLAYLRQGDTRRA